MAYVAGFRKGAEVSNMSTPWMRCKSFIRIRRRRKSRGSRTNKPSNSHTCIWKELNMLGSQLMMLFNLIIGNHHQWRCASIQQSLASCASAPTARTNSVLSSPPHAHTQPHTPRELVKPKEGNLRWVYFKLLWTCKNMLNTWAGGSVLTSINKSGQLTN